ncbi:ArnT family glycosyltransferase [Sciscionella sediminilitoris]|uniref:ArnT family glycosyltransferase n=1 Tax=Sciscionella sediminilitoris TaxID=1445613 RepID=UPI00055D5FAE|nr:glycosyltransferase family 39 protein [Sciscionella sp. SE31]
MESAPPAFARRPVLLLAGAAGVLLLAVSWRFGYFGDELYFLASWRYHLSWGYADNPWLLPLLARAMDAITPGSPLAGHVLAALLHVGGILCTAMLAREFGGGKRAQLLAGTAYAISLQLLASGHILASSTVDPFLWTLICLLLVRWVRVRNEWLLFGAGLVTAVAMQGKWLIVFFWITVAIGALILGPRDLVRRPGLLLGALITLAATVPTIIWQVRNGWPYFAMAKAAKSANDALFGGRFSIPVMAIVFAGVLLGAFLACHGTWQLLRDRRYADYRFLGLAVVLLVVLFTVMSSRYYYVAGVYGLVFAASAARVERVRPAAWWRWVPTWPVAALSALITIPLTIPVLPLAWSSGLQFSVSGTIGWPEVAATTATAYRQLPPGQRARTSVLAETYWQTAALEIYAHDRLPRIHGVERGYWYYGGPSKPGPVLYVGKEATREYLSRFFTGVREVGVTRLAAPASNINQGVRVWLCTGQRAPWPQLWNQLHRY